VILFLPMGSVRRRLASDERGSMPILMLVLLVGMVLSALLVPMIITSDRTTRFDITRVQALNAAQTGIDVTLGAVRASVTDAIGDSGKLPCGPLSGTVNSASIAAYSVNIEYFTFDPIAEPYPSSRGMSCVSGYGTFNAATGTTTPSYGRFTSTGTVGSAINGSAAGRTLSVTYVFRTSNVNLLGGIVQVSGGSVPLCMDVGSATAPAATAVVLQPCSYSVPPAAQQVFAYRTDLTLQLLASITTANPNGLCLSSAHTPGVSGDAIQLAQCGALGAPAYTQQWSYNDNGRYQAAQSTSVTNGVLPNLCMNVATAAASQAVTLSACSTSWIPSPSVGPGAAAVPQWINFGEFGRCLDVTNQDAGHAFLIDYPCKQNPFPGAKTWNQLFQAPVIPSGQASVTGQMITDNGQKYCLTSPGTAGGYVTVKTCVTGNALQTWTIYGGDQTLNYSTKYTIVNGSLCLGLTAPNAAIPQWSTIDVETCSGTKDQKWNADPNVLNSTLSNVFER
jgi:hypothetical protein